MGFADFYFSKYHSEKGVIDQPPEKDLGIVVAIPCYKEDKCVKALESLYFCHKPKCSAEVVVVVNYSDADSAVVEKQHFNIFRELSLWAEEFNSPKLKFYIFQKKLPSKTAGAGHARKIAMDEALRRFNIIQKPSGIIASFDADCTCDRNYLVELENLFARHPDTKGCSVYFEHPVSGDEYSKEIYSAIVQYELYLRYYVEALRHTGYPYAFHTLGSSFTVKAESYALQGGMNKLKAGEDFYFLNKIIPLGNFRELNTTRIIPSPRESDRVPFGTGVYISKMLQTEDFAFTAFNIRAFEIVAQFIAIMNHFFKARDEEIKKNVLTLDPSMVQFLEKNNYLENLKEINSNCSNKDSFKKRFFTWFNGLMILQYLNDSHKSYFKKVPLLAAVGEILKQRNIGYEKEDDLILLQKYREIQRKSNINSLKY
jgi:hypothetical protein